MSVTAERTMLLAAMTAMSTIAMLAVAVPTQAAPCNNYQFPAGLTLKQDNNITVRLDNSVTSIFHTVGASYYLNSFSSAGGRSSNMEPTKGHATGTVTGTTIDFTANWESGPGAGLSNHYTGVVNANGTAQGMSANSKGAQNVWASAPMTFICAQ